MYMYLKYRVYTEESPCRDDFAFVHAALSIRFKRTTYNTVRRKNIFAVFYYGEKPGNFARYRENRPEIRRRLVS